VLCALCPLTQTVLHDAVEAEDGRIYERQAIVEWIRVLDSDIMSSSSQAKVLFSGLDANGMPCDVPRGRASYAKASRGRVRLQGRVPLVTTRSEGDGDTAMRR
jgi:hypothetical protein